MSEEKVSHEDLNAAAEETEAAASPPADELEPGASEEEVAVEEEKEPAFTLPDEPEDNDERSMLGRKVKAMGDKVDDFVNRLDPILSRLSEVDNSDEDDDIITSKSDVIKVLRAEKEQEQTHKAKYAQTVESELVDLGLSEKLDEATHIEVFKDAQANWKPRTGDAKVDAELNFQAALLRVTRKQIEAQKEPVNPLIKNAGEEEEALGGPAESAVKPKSKAIPKLDEYAKDFVQRTGMTTESIEDALTGDAPTYLSGKV